jgi:two-component system, chemotaxis family, sensor kinase CheA
MSDYLDPANEELLKDFFVEAEMQVETLESNILVLESDPHNADSVDEIFRAAHTLKGGAATVQMSELASFTHLVEDALDEIRAGRASIGETTIDTLLTAIDVIKAMLTERQAGQVYGEDTSSVAAALRAIIEGRADPAEAPAGVEVSPTATPAQAPPATSVSPATSSGSTPGGSQLSEYDLLELKEAAGDGHGLYAVTVTFREDNPMNTVGGIQLFAALKQFSEVLKTDPDFDQLYEDTFHPQVIYYVASGENPEDYRSKLEISDVTSSVAIEEIGPGGSVGHPVASAAPSVERKEEPIAPASASAASAAPAASSAPAASPAAPSEGKAPKEDRSVSVPAPLPEEASDDGPENGEGEGARPEATRRAAQTGSILRVDSRRIDNLLNLVSETVINKAGFNQISNLFSDNLAAFAQAETQHRELLKELFDSLPDYLEEIRNGASPKEVRKRIGERFGALPTLFDGFHSGLKTTVGKFRNTSQNLGRIAGELQEGVMRIRMVPISQIFSRFPRLVRDLSRSLNKKIDLVIEGEDTELDKSVIEDLLDPLIHCVRNSIDHGIEDPAGRSEAGKETVGTVSLRASNEGNMILIEVIDDGRGIDVDAVRKKAVDRGVIHPNKQLSDVEAFNLIFDPGFSTAREITDVSGRGVGLDVVKRQIEKLNGTVTVWSERGAGTRFTIKIPLTLAIIQGLLVRVGKETYAIPITSVIDSHRIKPTEIKMIDNYEVFNVRDDVVSLVRLSRLFRIPTNENPTYHYVVIVGTSERKMGLIVDSLIGEEDVVIKPLRDHFTNSPGIAGANITGDGKVSLIIDVSQLLELGLRREKEERARREMTIGS